MSTRDHISFINDSFKQTDSSGKIGNNIQLVAQQVNSSTNIWNTILPNCGPLLIIPQSEINWTSGCTISFTYEEVTSLGWGTGYQLDQEYYYQSYTGADYSAVAYGTGSLYIETGTRVDRQYLYTGSNYIHKIRSLTVDPPSYDVDIYCLSDDGSRLVQGWNAENERDIIDQLYVGSIVHPPLCHRCTGSKVWDSGVCPDCNGYGYVGQNAKKWLLTRQASSVGITRGNESLESFTNRIWAKKWKMVPTKKEIKRYLSHFLRLDEDDITISEKYYPDCVWTVRIPLTNAGLNDIGNRLSTSGNTIQSLLDDVTPAGTNAVVEPYYYIQGDDSVLDYENPDSEKYTGMMNPLPRSDSFIPCTWGSSWNDLEWFGGSEKYFNENSGIINIDGTGCYSGGVSYTDSGFFVGIYSGFYDKNLKYDNFFTGLSGAGGLYWP